jgi:signal transduction histidine kinase
MSGEFALDWAIVAVSLFDTILLLWLGLTVLLNAERRTWGIWLAGGGLLMGAAFFVSHTAILGIGTDYVGPGTEFWWHVGWVPVVALPFVWYVLMLWYAGYWDHRQGALRRRQRPWLILSGAEVLVLILLLAVANPLPSYGQVARLDLAATPAVAGIPIVMLLYPLYTVLCIGLSLDALRRPEPSARLMGDLARHRARPWLAASSLVLLAVSLLVAWAMLWVVSSARQRAPYAFDPGLSLPLARFDLAIASLIGLSIVLVGQAIVAYEVFAGKTLPRRGLKQHWRRAVILAAGYGLAVGWSLTLQLRAIYGLLLATLLMALFYALLSWRSFVERERTMAHLRPFVAGPHLYEHLLAPSPSPALDLEVQTWFRALCDEVLGARAAYLTPLGALAPLIGSALAYPERERSLLQEAAMRVAAVEALAEACVPLDPAAYHGAMWAVPLRGEQGLVGVLLIGAKQDGGLYTQEEIEIAQSSGERLVDTLASIEVTRRLLALQRQRLAESRDYGELSRAVFDQRARRLLHDEVLPLLHTAMLTLSSVPMRADGAVQDSLETLADAHRQISNLLREMPAIAGSDVARLGLAGALHEALESELAGAFDGVTWEVDEQAEGQARTLSPLATEVVFYAVREAMRNAARHGRDRANERPLHLWVKMVLPEPKRGLSQRTLEVRIEDDGVGLESGLKSDRTGQGLSLHSTMMSLVGGTLAVERRPGGGTCIQLTLPVR